MQQIICDRQKDPLGVMLLDYLHGDHSVQVDVHSTTLEMSAMDGQTMFRAFADMGEIERQALHRCYGRILDVGAGSGCHTLRLQERGFQVDALEISPGCIEVMRQRQVQRPMHGSVFSLKGEQCYNTILMLMNGMGICGSLAGIHYFFQLAWDLLEGDGQILADSTDISGLYADETDLDRLDGYYGETEFVMTYNSIESEPFSWIYIDYVSLQRVAVAHGLVCEKVVTGADGSYLARIHRP